LLNRLPAEQPIQANIERVSYVAKPIKRKMDGRKGKVAAGIGRQARAFRNLLRGKPSGLASIYKAMRKLRYVRHVTSPFGPSITLAMPREVILIECLRRWKLNLAYKLNLIPATGNVFNISYSLRKSRGIPSIPSDYALATT
jgi:hypothetical protein